MGSPGDKVREIAFVSGNTIRQLMETRRLAQAPVVGVLSNLVIEKFRTAYNAKHHAFLREQDGREYLSHEQPTDIE